MLRYACFAAFAVFVVFAAPAQAAPPSNDSFANAITLPAAPSPTPGTTVEATRETGEPQHHDDSTTSQASVWYRWTAPASATVQFDTCTTNYDTHLGVYTGSAVNALTPVRRNNNDGCDVSTGQFGSRVVFNARKGVEYRIAVDGCCGAPTGTFTLTLTTPGNADFARRFFFIDPAVNVISVIGGPSGNQTGESGPGNSSVWYTWIAPSTGTVTVNTCGQTASAINSHLTVYTGSDVSTLATVASNDDTSGCIVLSGNSTGSSLSFEATRGAEYAIRVARSIGVQTRFRLRINATPLAHDELAGARTLAGRSPAAEDSTLGASYEVDEPIALVPFSGGSLWYRWTAPVGGEAVSIDTCGSAIPTRARVFTGSAFASLQPVGTNADSACVNGSVVTLTPAAGTNYAVQAENETGAQGETQVNWSPQTYVSDGPPATVAASEVQFHFDSYDTTEGNGGLLDYSCSLDGGAFQACDSPETYRGVSAGSHTFRVRAVDAGGAVDPSPATRAFRTTAPPAVRGPAGPAGPAGPPGPAGRDGLFVGIASSRLSSVAGKRVRVPYLSTGPAAVVLEVRRGRRVVARVRGRANRGRNRITWNGKVRRKAARAGRYTVRLTAAAGGVSASDQVALRVARRKKR
jgi:hypothetical protein